MAEQEHDPQWEHYALALENSVVQLEADLAAEREKVAALEAKAALADEIMALIERQAYDRCYPYGSEIDWIARYQQISKGGSS